MRLNFRNMPLRSAMFVHIIYFVNNLPFGGLPKFPRILPVNLALLGIIESSAGFPLHLPDFFEVLSGLIVLLLAGFLELLSGFFVQTTGF